jgi:hypothetical protein
VGRLSDTIRVYGRDTSFGRTKVRDAHRVPVESLDRASVESSADSGLDLVRRRDDERTRLRRAVRRRFRDYTPVDLLEQVPGETLQQLRSRQLKR